MLGKARLRAKACPININDKLEDIQKTCTYTTEELLAEDDPTEMKASHIGTEDEKIDSNICKLESNNEMKVPQITCVYVVGIIGLA